MSGRRRVLLVDDDRDFVTWLREQLEIEGYDVVCAYDGETALRRAVEDRPDLVLLDWIMPRLTGKEVSRELRRLNGRLPIIMLTRLSEPHHEAGGLEYADDFVCKPFEPLVLFARIRARLRETGAAPVTEARYLRIGERVFDQEARRLFTLDRRERPLAPNVGKLLWFLVRNQGRLLTRQQILDHVWGFELDGSERVVDQHVSRLNQALRDSVDAPRLVRSVKGEGYIFDGPVTPVAW